MAHEHFDFQLRHAALSHLGRDRVADRVRRNANDAGALYQSFEDRVPAELGVPATLVMNERSVGC